MGTMQTSTCTEENSRAGWECWTHCQSGSDYAGVIHGDEAVQLSEYVLKDKVRGMNVLRNVDLPEGAGTQKCDTRGRCLHLDKSDPGHAGVLVEMGSLSIKRRNYESSSFCPRSIHGDEAVLGEYSIVRIHTEDPTVHVDVELGQTAINPPQLPLNSSSSILPHPPSFALSPTRKHPEMSGTHEFELSRGHEWGRCKHEVGEFRKHWLVPCHSPAKLLTRRCAGVVHGDEAALREKELKSDAGHAGVIVLLTWGCDEAELGKKELRVRSRVGNLLRDVHVSGGCATQKPEWDTRGRAKIRQRNNVFEGHGASYQLLPPVLVYQQCDTSETQRHKYAWEPTEERIGSVPSGQSSLMLALVGTFHSRQDILCHTPNGNRLIASAASTAQLPLLRNRSQCQVLRKRRGFLGKPAYVWTILLTHGTYTVELLVRNQGGAQSNQHGFPHVYEAHTSRKTGFFFGRATCSAVHGSRTSTCRDAVARRSVIEGYIRNARADEVAVTLASLHHGDVFDHASRKESSPAAPLRLILPGHEAIIHPPPTLLLSQSFILHFLRMPKRRVCKYHSKLQVVCDVNAMDGTEASTTPVLRSRDAIRDAIRTQKLELQLRNGDDANMIVDKGKVRGVGCICGHAGVEGGDEAHTEEPTVERTKDHGAISTNNCDRPRGRQ
ncbi:hypothetical protein BJ508DRAFT_311785 [Ascobolus immersus RN42]|uniref:Uncharacterized protein n=1 Tax=Ascobolus immersus RN42 TaxID=1160509 RepID=A0A3N4HPE1_ASCIM|nr:hypothetical protein BJ508DRAFT_311785 [Ascobolus immersus RN42]